MSFVDWKCPSCGSDNEYELERENQGDEIEIQCKKCHKYFHAEVDVTVDLIVDEVPLPED